MASKQGGTVINGQTCLEKRGIKERGIELDRNLYTGINFISQYSPSHPNATSEPESVKGKGRNGSGHLHSLPYTGTPKTDINRIDPSNFTTISVDGATIGGKYDIDSRDEAEARSLFKRDANEYSVTNENALSDGNVHGKGTGIELDTANGGGGYDVIQRDYLIRKNYYDNIILSHNYSILHDNAKSTPDAPGAEGMKGKSTGGGGHLYFQGYYGKPRGTENMINYSNFTTFEDAGVTIGNRADVDKRKELYLTRRYNRDEGSYYTSSHPDAMSNGDIIGKGTGIELDTTNGGGAYDVRLRTEHLEQNVWKKDVIEYTKPLVLAEYQIQTEFKISTHDEDVKEKQERTAAEKAKKEAKAAAKKKAKMEKREEKLRRKELKESGKQTDDKGNKIKPEPYEKRYDYQDNKSNDDATFSDYGYRMA